jgi:hypothetical protein
MLAWNFLRLKYNKYHVHNLMKKVKMCPNGKDEINHILVEIGDVHIKD